MLIQIEKSWGASALMYSFIALGLGALSSMIWSKNDKAKTKK